MLIKSIALINELRKLLSTRPKENISVHVLIYLLTGCVALSGVAISGWSDTTKILDSFILGLGIYCGLGFLYGLLFRLYKGNNVVIIFSINILTAIPPTIFYVVLYLLKFLTTPFFGLFLVFLVLLNLFHFLVTPLELITKKTALFISISTVTIIASYFGNIIIRYINKATASSTSTKTEIEEDYKRMIAIINQNLFTYLIYIFYFLSIGFFTIVNLNNGLDSHLKDYQEVLVPSFALFICFERLIKNSHLTLLGRYLNDRLK